MENCEVIIPISSFRTIWVPNYEMITRPIEKWIPQHALWTQKPSLAQCICPWDRFGFIATVWGLYLICSLLPTDGDEVNVVSEKCTSRKCSSACVGCALHILFYFTFFNVSIFFFFLFKCFNQCPFTVYKSPCFTLACFNGSMCSTMNCLVLKCAK